MVTKLKQYNPKASEIVSDWQVVDADGQVLGRLATQVAMFLMGKHKPTYVPHMLTGDFVVVINASKIKVTGQKAEKKIYKRYSQYPGTLKEIPYSRLQERQPERIIELAVKGMLPKNKLGRRMMTRLKIYAGAEHPHSAQILGSERREEREAAAAIKAEAAAKVAAVKAEAAAKAAAKPAAKKAPAKKVSAPKAEAVATEVVETAEAAPAKKAPAKKTTAKKPAAKKAPAKKAAAKKPAAKKPAANKATATTKKKATAAKKPAAKKTTAKKPAAKAASKSGEK
jgi:large subunit ribosomal protein L13